jgi:hypothetical protein
MTLRDWFAGQALTGLLGVVDSMKLVRITEKEAKDFPPAFSLSAYALADAMLEVRERAAS